MLYSHMHKEANCNIIEDCIEKFTAELWLYS